MKYFTDHSVTHKEAVMSMQEIQISVKKCIRAEVEFILRECGEKYGFDAEEAISSHYSSQDNNEILEWCKESLVDLTRPNVVGVPLTQYTPCAVVSSTVVAPVKKAVKSRAKSTEKKKNAFQFPYNGSNENTCQGLRKNGGLYTQCENDKCEDKYCSLCDKESKINEDGRPNAGNVEQRESVGYNDYKDRKGLLVMLYSKYMSKNGITREMIEAEEIVRNELLDLVHFEETNRKQGRRTKGGKKGKVVETDDSTDLFLSLVKKGQTSQEVSSSDPSEVMNQSVPFTDPPPRKVYPVNKMVEEEEEEEEELQQEVNQSEVTNQSEVVNQPEIMNQSEEVNQSEVTNQSEVVNQPEIMNQSEDVNQPEIMNQPEVVNQPEIMNQSEDVNQSTATEVMQQRFEKSIEEVDAEEEEVDRVKKITYLGTKYLRSKKSGAVYDYLSQLIIGKWNDETESIDFHENEEEVECGYDYDN